MCLLSESLYMRQADYRPNLLCSSLHCFCIHELAFRYRFVIDSKASWTEDYISWAVRHTEGDPQQAALSLSKRVNSTKPCWSTQLAQLFWHFGSLSNTENTHTQQAAQVLERQEYVSSVNFRTFAAANPMLAGWASPAAVGLCRTNLVLMLMKSISAMLFVICFHDCIDHYLCWCSCLLLCCTIPGKSSTVSLLVVLGQLDIHAVANLPHICGVSHASQGQLWTVAQARLARGVLHQASKGDNIGDFHISAHKQMWQSQCVKVRIH